MFCLWYLALQILKKNLFDVIHFLIICLVCPKECDAVMPHSVAICSSHSNTHRAKTHFFSTMTQASIVSDIIMHNANYALMLLGTFALFQVNRLYREFVNGIQLVGASFHHHRCLRCGNKDILCINKKAGARRVSIILLPGILCRCDASLVGPRRQTIYWICS